MFYLNLNRIIYGNNLQAPDYIENIKIIQKLLKLSIDLMESVWPRYGV